DGDIQECRYGVESWPVAVYHFVCRIQNAVDLRALVVDDPAALLVPQHRHADLAGVAWIVLAIEAVERVAALGRAVRTFAEGPPFLWQPPPRVGVRHHALEPLQHAVGERARGPGADIGDPKVVTPRLGAKLGARLGRYHAAEPRLLAHEAAVLADLFLGGKRVHPLAFDQP